MAKNKKGAGAGRASRKTPKINIIRYFQVLGVTLGLILVSALLAIGFFRYDDISNSSTKLVPDATSKVEGDKINILLMCTDNEGLLTDSIMLASYDMKENDVNLLSIPRDTRIFVGNRYQKINAAHAYTDKSGKPAGAQGTVEAVTRLTGVPINYYVDFTFDSIARCVDAVGPVEFEIPDLYDDGVGMVYDDPEQDLHINLKPGLQKLDGEKVVHLLRYRKGNPDSKGVRKTYLRGDLDRIDVQKEFIKTFIDQKLNASLILKVPSLFKEISSGFDTNMTLSDIIKYHSSLSGISSESIHAFTVPGVDDYIREGDYDVSYFIADLDGLREIIRDNFGYPANEITIEKEYVKPDKTEQPKDTAEATEKPASSGGESSSSSKNSADQGNGNSQNQETETRQTERSSGSQSSSGNNFEVSSSGTQSSSSGENTQGGSSAGNSDSQPARTQEHSGGTQQSEPSKTETPTKQADDE